MENNKRKLSGGRSGSSNVAVVIPPMRERGFSSSSQGSAPPPRKEQKGKAVEHIEISPVPQSKPSEMAKPRQGLFGAVQTSAALPEAAQTDRPDSPPSQLPAVPVPQPPLEEIIHRVDRAASPGSIDNVPVILSVAQSIESNTANLFPETCSSPEAEPAVRPPQKYDQPVRLPSISDNQQNTPSISHPNQPLANQASSEIGLDASSVCVQGSILAPPQQRNMAAPVPLIRSPQSVNWDSFSMPVGPVVIHADSLSLEEAELFSRLYYVFIRSTDADPNNSEAEARILSLLQRWHGVADIAANEDDTFSIRRGIHVGNGISYACISLKAKVLLAGIGKFFQNMVHSIDIELASMSLVELRDSHDLGMINYFHLQKLDKAFLWSAAARMAHHYRDETIIPEDVRRRAALAAGISTSTLPRTSHATSSSGAVRSSNTPNNSIFYHSSNASANSSVTPASSCFSPSGGSGTSPNTGIFNNEGSAGLSPRRGLRSPEGGF